MAYWKLNPATSVALSDGDRFDIANLAEHVVIEVAARPISSASGTAHMREMCYVDSSSTRSTTAMIYSRWTTKLPSPKQLRWCDHVLRWKNRTPPAIRSPCSTVECSTKLASGQAASGQPPEHLNARNSPR